jgi:hypothetical protein
LIEAASNLASATAAGIGMIAIGVAGAGLCARSERHAATAAIVTAPGRSIVTPSKRLLNI